jgi:hypothetical protein
MTSVGENYIYVHNGSSPLVDGIGIGNVIINLSGGRNVMFTIMEAIANIIYLPYTFYHI